MTMYERSECVLSIEEWGATDVLGPSLTLPQFLALTVPIVKKEQNWPTQGYILY